MSTDVKIAREKALKIVKEAQLNMAGRTLDGLKTELEKVLFLFFF